MRFFYSTILAFLVVQLVYGHESCLFKSCDCISSAQSAYRIICNKQGSGNSKFPTRDSSSKITNIESIYFGNYSFSEIPDKIFADLEIGKMTFRQNQLVEISKDAFTNIKSLGELVLLEEKLETIVPGSFWPVYNSLRKVDITGSRLSYSVLKNLFQELRHVRTLEVFDLAGNNLTRLDKDLLVGLNNLTSLDLSSNQIRYIDEDTFQDQKCLSGVNLSNNDIQNLSMVIHALKKVELTVKVLDLSYNEIADASTDTYLWNLIDLNLRGNKITAIGLNCLSGFYYLTWLDLESNQISRIDSNGLEKFAHLQHVFLGNNYLTRVPALSKLEKLYELSLQNQNTKLRRIDNYAFERNGEPDYMRLDLSKNDFETFGDKAFCSRNFDQAKILELNISYLTAERINLCLLKQLHLKNYSHPVKIYIDPPIGVSETNYAEVCTCDRFAFAKNYNFFIKGICESVFNSSCQNTVFVDTCQSLKYSCDDIVTETTTRSSTTRVTTNAAKGIKGSTHVTWLSIFASVVLLFYSKDSFNLFKTC